MVGMNRRSDGSADTLVRWGIVGSRLGGKGVVVLPWRSRVRPRRLATNDELWTGDAGGDAI